MKQFKKVLLILLAVVSFSNMYAQDEDNPWSVDIGTNAVDFYPTGADFYPMGISGGNFVGGMFEDFFNVSDHWNASAAISRLRIGRYIGNGFGVGLNGSFNSIKKIGDYETGENIAYFGLDLDINYHFVRDHGWFDPYALVGGGYTWVDSEGAGTFNGGIGFDLWFNDNVGINLQSTYKHSFDDDVLLPHFQHAAGIKFKFGGKDTDGDGIYDKYDECPNEAGLEQFNGCPDTDGDGIPDKDDECPTEAGLAEFNGCPDTDGDGIPDNKDACPTEAGLASLNGCPDADGDGVADKDDECPNEAGPAENKGCPWPDTDGDGVVDKDDECPNVAGPAENNGCPLVTEEVQKQITDLARSIYFRTGKATFTSETQVRLENITKILAEYKDTKFYIEGHTDSTGSKKINDKLSQERADAVKNYLIEQGFPAENLESKGYGSDQPIGNNKTRKGRQENRRVEILSEHHKK